MLTISNEQIHVTHPCIVSNKEQVMKLYSDGIIIKLDADGEKHLAGLTL